MSKLEIRSIIRHRFHRLHGLVFGFFNRVHLRSSVALFPLSALPLLSQGQACPRAGEGLADETAALWAEIQ
jgi:hypothetical protein